MVIRTKGTIYAPDLYEFPNRTLHALEKPNRASKQDGEDHDSAVRRAGPEKLGREWTRAYRSPLVILHHFLPKAGRHDSRAPYMICQP